MTNEELLEILNQKFDSIDKRFDSMDRGLDSVGTRLDSLEVRIDRLENSAEETRCGVNALLEWAEECGNVIKFPLPKVK